MSRGRPEAKGALEPEARTRSKRTADRKALLAPRGALGQLPKVGSLSVCQAMERPMDDRR
jgi:hypothetical protein